MTQSVRAGWLENTGFEPRLFESSLQYRLVKMMPAFFPADPIDIVTGCRKYPPAPLSTGVRILARESIRQCNATFLDIFLMLVSNRLICPDSRIEPP